MTVSADGTEVYVTRLATGEVLVIETVSGDLSIVATIPATDALALPFVAAPVGTDLYVVNSRLAADPAVPGDVLVTPQPNG